jgi:hypothetical protein
MSKAAHWVPSNNSAMINHHILMNNPHGMPGLGGMNSGHN